MGSHMQKVPLVPRDTDFTHDLMVRIEEMDEKIKNERILKARTKEEKKHNKQLYNMKAVMIRSKLRSHFRELEVTPEQYNYFRGRLTLQIKRFRVRWDLYHKDMTKQHKVKKLQFGFLQTDIYSPHMPDPTLQKEIENDRGKSLYQLFEEAYEKRKKEFQELGTQKSPVTQKRKRERKKFRKTRTISLEL